MRDERSPGLATPSRMKDHASQPLENSGLALRYLPRGCLTKIDLTLLTFPSCHRRSRHTTVQYTIGSHTHTKARLSDVPR